MILDLRKQQILKAVVEHFIATGEPVGSKHLSEQMNLGVSPATIRNELAALTASGYLEQPHTSAGRIPTHNAYRLYINSLMQLTPLSEEGRTEIEREFLMPPSDPERLVKTAGKVLADITNCAAISTVPQPQIAVINQIEVTPVGKKLFLLILVTSTGIIKNKICRVDFDVSVEALEFFMKFANKCFGYTEIESITLPFVQTLAAAMGEYSLTLSPLLFGIYELCQEIIQVHVNLEGSSNLLDHKELDPSAKSLLKILAKPNELQNLVTKSESKTGVILGSNLETLAFSDASFIFTKYEIDGNVAGAIGIIGPVRQDYAKVIPKLEYFAYLLGKLLEDSLGE